MISEIYIQVSFLKHTLLKKDSGVVEGDYNTTKLIFRFDEDVSGKRIVFQMSDPQGDVIMITELNSSHEVMLAGTDNEGNVCTLFNEPGLYPFELVIYDTDAKLTSAPGWLTVNKQQVDVDNQIVEAYIPFFDELIQKVGELQAYTYANTLRGTKSGEAFLIDDISCAPHEMGVKVRGKNLFDINGFINLTGNSTYYGINDNGELYVKQSDFRDDTVIPAFVTLEAGTYTLSSTTAITTNFKLINLTDNKVIAFNNNITFSIEKATSLGIKYWQSANTVIGKLQLELGTTATAYAPYVPDLTAVKVTRCGKNLLSNLTYIEPKNLTTEIGYSEKIRLKTGLSYTFSIASISNATSWRLMAHIYENGIMVSAGDNNLVSNDWFTGNISMYCPKNQNYFMDQANQTVLENITYKITVLKDCEICFGLYLGDTSTATISNNAQLELGTTATEYEPYITPTEYTPTADGTVEGVASLYPNTTLMTDTEGVLINCEYSRDINKAFAALEPLYSQLSELDSSTDELV